MKYDWSKERLEKTSKEANCWFNWLEILGIPKRGYNYRTLKNKATEYSIDVSHFNYEYAKTHNGKRSVSNQTSDGFFSSDNTHNMGIIKREYINRILDGDARCEICGVKEWLGKPIVLQIHHIDGNHKNNSVKNLQLLCPNCHTQTDTYSNKKRS
jgi:5-methylcytosine-specific restriction endonuclease McrA